MFNIGSGEIALIAVVALLILGPKRLPELARGIGKFVREFRRQTDEVRGVVEREFYKMDQEVSLPPPEAPLLPKPAQGAVANGSDPLGHDLMGHDANGNLLPGHDGLAQLGSGMPQGEPVPPPAPPAVATSETPAAPSAETAAPAPPSSPSPSSDPLKS
ncbi:MAG: twin-arginine translocase TatA/TatE family subunit [Archangium sp.]|nr:twin-arginine translocase TatA/TatE family subunit [Archangium sp.]